MSKRSLEFKDPETGQRKTVSYSKIEAYRAQHPESSAGKSNKNIAMLVHVPLVRKKKQQPGNSVNALTAQLKKWSLKNGGQLQQKPTKPKPPKLPKVNNGRVNEERKQFVIKWGADGKRKTYSLDTLRSLQSQKPNLQTRLKNAAAAYQSMKNQKPQPGKSGWAYNLKNFGKKYYLWTGKKHVVVVDVPADATENMVMNMYKKSKEKAPKPPKVQRQGWSNSGSRFYVNDKPVKREHLEAGRKMPGMLPYSNRGLAEIAAEHGVNMKRGQYVTKDDRKTYQLEALKYLRNKHGLKSFAEAAEMYKNMKQSKMPDGESGWMMNVKNMKKKYYLWVGSRHEKISMTEMKEQRTNNSQTDQQVAMKAFQKRQVGWSGPDKKSYGVYTENKLVRIPGTKLRKIMMRLRQFGKPSDEHHAALAYLQKQHGKFNYRKNEYQGSAGPVPGNTFAAEYSRLKNVQQNNENEPAFQNLHPDRANLAAAKHWSGKADALTEKRKEIDAQWLAKLPKNPTFAQMTQWLRDIFSVGGPLAGRPMITGNVGIPGDERSPLEQLNGPEDPSICSQLFRRQWPDGLGKSLQLHQSVIYTVANLRAADRLMTPGLLAVHSTGSGKSNSGFAAMVAFWNKTTSERDGKKPWGIVTMAVRSNQKKTLDEWVTAAVTFFPWFRNEVEGIDEHPFATKQLARRSIRRRLMLGFQTLGIDTTKLREEQLISSYTTFTRIYPDSQLRNCMVICDEIQLLFSVTSSEKGYQKEYQQARKLLKDRKPYNTFVLAMTATPGEDTESVRDVMQIVAAKSIPATTQAIAKEAQAGMLVSYVYTSADTSKFPRVTVVHDLLDLDKTDGEAFGKYAARYAESLMRRPEARVDALKNWTGNTSPLKEAEFNKELIEYSKDDKHRFYKMVKQYSEWLRMSTASTINYTGQNDMNSYLEQRIGWTPNKKFYIWNGVKIPKNVMDKRRKVPGQENWRDSRLAQVQDNWTNNNEGNASVKNSSTALHKNASEPAMPIVMTRPGGGTSRTAAEGGNEMFYLLSPKLIKALLYIIKAPGVQFVYSTSRMTLRLMAWMLQTRFGFRQFTTHDKKVPGKVFGFLDPVKQPPTTYYDPVSKKYGRLLDVNVPNTKALKGTDTERGVLQYPENILDGRFCKVVFATADSFKGVDIGGLRDVHMMSPLPEYTDILQLVGRGTRFCGHKTLPRSQRSVRVHVYRLTKDSRCPALGSQEARLLSNCSIMQDAIERSGQFLGIDNELMKNAVDRLLFAKYSTASQQLHAALKFDVNPLRVRRVNNRVEVVRRPTPENVVVDERVPTLTNVIALAKPKPPRKKKEKPPMNAAASNKKNNSNKRKNGSSGSAKSSGRAMNSTLIY